MKLNFSGGFSSIFRGISIIRKYQLWSYTIIPSILSVILLILVFWGISSAFSYLQTFIPNNDNSALISFLYSAAHFAVSVLSFFSYIIAVVFIFPILLNLLIQPFLGSLSEAVEKSLTGIVPEPQISFLTSLYLGIKFALKMFIIESVLLFLSGFIPVIGQIIVFFVGSYFLGSGFFDLVLERKTRTLEERTAWMSAHKSVLIGQGAAVRLFSLVPFIGSIFAMLGATAGAVELYLVHEGKIPG